jgi:hypothetical protein
MWLIRSSWAPTLVFCATASALHAQDGIPAGEFAKLRDLIRPHEVESNWRRVNWLTSLHDGRVKAATEGKPILLWSGGGAPPLGGC